MPLSPLVWGLGITFFKWYCRYIYISGWREICVLFRQSFQIYHYFHTLIISSDALLLLSFFITVYLSTRCWYIFRTGPLKHLHYQSGHTFSCNVFSLSLTPLYIVEVHLTCWRHQIHEQCICNYVAKETLLNNSKRFIWKVAVWKKLKFEMFLTYVTLFFNLLHNAVYVSFIHTQTFDW